MSEILDKIKAPFSKISKVAAEFFVVPEFAPAVDLKAYIKNIESGAWKDRVVMGITDKTRTFHTVDPFSTPGQCAIGGMGSGKSVAMRFLVYTHMMCNSENTLYILCDPAKGMGDYKAAFQYTGNVVCAIKSVEQFITIMDMTSQELLARQKAFNAVGAENIVAYDKIMRAKNPDYKGLARVMMCFEEFAVLSAAKIVRLGELYDREGTSAFQMRHLMRVGRSYGFNVVIATQRATYEDIPSTLKPGLNTFMAFKTNNSGDIQAANLPSNLPEIKSSQRGRCLWEEGQMQFPYIEEDLSNALLKKYVKPLRAELLGKTIKEYHQAMESETTEGLVKVKPLVSLLNSKDQFNPVHIARRFLTEFDFQSEEQHNSALVADLIAERDGRRFAVVVKDDLSDKSVAILERSLDLLNCQGVIAIPVQGFRVNSELQELCRKTRGTVVESDDLEMISKLIDNKDRFEPSIYAEKFADTALSRKAFIRLESVKEDLAANDFDMPEFSDTSEFGVGVRPRKIRLPDSD